MVSTPTVNNISNTVISPPMFYNSNSLTNPITVTIDAAKFKILNSVSIYLSGDPAGTKNQVADWRYANSDAITAAGLATLTNVSSWAIVVDITWKKAFANVRN